MKPWDIIKLGLVLMIYAAAACVGLAFVYAGTEKTIEKQVRDAQKAALKELFPGADDDGFEEITGTIPNPAGGTVTFESEYAAKQGGKIIGVVLQASGKSYGGAIKILVGVNADGTISGVKVTEHADTPGFGAYAADPNYYVNEAEKIPPFNSFFLMLVQLSANTNSEEKKITFTGQFNGRSLDDPLEVKKDIIAISGATITSRAVASIVKTTGLAAKQWLAEQGAKE
jgi:electron transport complex protein RnfG